MWFTLAGRKVLHWTPVDLRGMAWAVGKPDKSANRKAPPRFDLDKKCSKASKLARRGASMDEVATDRDGESRLKRKRTIPGGIRPKDTTRQRGKAVGAGSSFHPPTVSRPQLPTTVVNVSPRAPRPGRSRKSEPSQWDRSAAAPQTAAARLEDVANTDFEDDTSYEAAPAQTMRESHPTKFSPAEKKQGSGGRWSTEAGDRQARLSNAFSGQNPRRVSQSDPTRKRMTRAQTGGDDALMWGNKPTRKRSAAASDDAPYRARHTPVEDSPSTKRAKEKQAELKKQGNQIEEAITLSSDEEPDENESEDEPGVISFQLDNEKVFFGPHIKPAGKKIRFSEKGLQIPAAGVWGDGKDADIVPYEEIESLTYGDGKHLFLSIVLDLESAKLNSLEQVTPGLRRRKFQEECKSRILLPLRASQAEVFAERRQRIKDKFISETLVDLDKFFVQARAHQVTDLLANTPYKVRQMYAGTARRFAAAHFLRDACTQVRRTTRSASVASSASAASDTLMVYYPDHGKSRVKITKADFDVLGEHEMLNDSAIDFYLKWIEHEVVAKSSEMVDQFLFFGTFFFKKMTTQIKAKLRGPTARLDRLASVEKYNSRGGESIWNRRFLIIPINEAFHWSLAIACIGRQDQEDEHSQKTAAATTDDCMHEENPTAAASAPRPRKIDLLYFDSLGHKGRKHCKEIVEYLNYKWNKEYSVCNDSSKLKVDHPYTMPPAVTRESSSSPTYDDNSSSQINLVQKKAPNQENGHDCGVFLLEYAERFVKEIIFQAARGIDCADYIQAADFHEWFVGETARKKRTHIQQLLLHLERQRMEVEKQEAQAKDKDKASASDKKSDQTGKENISDGKANAASAAGPDDDVAPTTRSVEGKQVPPPRQEIEVWMRLQNQRKGKTNLRSFVVPESEVDSADGTINLLQEFKEWFKKSSGEDVGDVQKLKLYRRRTVWKSGKEELELDINTSPDGNFLAFGDNLMVQSDFYDLQTAELAHASAEMIDVEDEFQPADGGKTRAATGAATDANTETTAPKQSTSVPTARIPRKKSKNDTVVPPLPNPSESQQPADPEWVDKQTKARHTITTAKVDTDDSADEGDRGSPADAVTAAGTSGAATLYGKRPQRSVQNQDDGETEDQQISREQETRTKNRRPPPLPPRPAERCAGATAMLRTAASATHLNKR